MKVAVITPYHRESIETLQRCIESVAEQSHAVTHFLVADGASPTLVNDVIAVLRMSDQHIALPVAHGDYGDTPRLIGTTAAYAQGFEAVCWLDADCWFEPNHVAEMVKLATREVASIVTATRKLRRPDGSLLDVCTESDGVSFSDTNCYLVCRDAIPGVAPMWGFKPQNQAVVGDRRVWEAAKAYRRTHLAAPTVNYETKIAVHYLERGEQPPNDARVIVRMPGESYYRSVLYKEVS